MCTEPEPNEFIFQIVMMNLRLLALTSKDLKDVRENWKDLLERGYGYSFRNWLQLLLLEEKYGDTSTYRQQLSRATAYVKDDIHSIANLWLNFERDNGDLTQMQACESKISKYFRELSVADLASSNSTWGNTPRRDFQSGKNKVSIFYYVFVISICILFTFSYFVYFLYLTNTRPVAFCKKTFLNYDFL